MRIQRFFTRVFRGLGTLVRRVFPRFGPRKSTTNEETVPLVSDGEGSDNSTTVNDGGEISISSRSYERLTGNTTSDITSIASDLPGRPTREEIGELRHEMRVLRAQLDELRSQVGIAATRPCEIPRTAPTISNSSHDSSSLPSYRGDHVDDANPDAPYGVMTGPSTMTDSTAKKTQ